MMLPGSCSLYRIQTAEERRNINRLFSVILANNWWARSPNVTNSTNFWNVNTNGGSNNNNANNANGLAPRSSDDKVATNERETF